MYEEFVNDLIEMRTKQDSLWVLENISSILEENGYCDAAEFVNEKLLSKID